MKKSKYTMHGQILVFLHADDADKTQIIADFFLLYTYTYAYAIINLRKSLKSASSACKKLDRVWYNISFVLFRIMYSITQVLLINNLCNKIT